MPSWGNEVILGTTALLKAEKEVTPQEWMERGEKGHRHFKANHTAEIGIQAKIGLHKELS